MIEEVPNQGEIAILTMAHGKANAMSFEFCKTLCQRLEEVGSGPAKAW